MASNPEFHCFHDLLRDLPVNPDDLKVLHDMEPPNSCRLASFGEKVTHPLQIAVAVALVNFSKYHLVYGFEVEDSEFEILTFY